MESDLPLVVGSRRWYRTLRPAAIALREENERLRACGDGVLNAPVCHARKSSSGSYECNIMERLPHVALGRPLMRVLSRNKNTAQVDVYS